MSPGWRRVIVASLSSMPTSARSLHSAILTLSAHNLDSLPDPRFYWRLRDAAERGMANRFSGSPEEAADVLANIVANHRFTLYEYFMTDKAGHAQDFNAARSILIALGKFITQLLSRIDLAKTTVVLTSDHGNIEDLSTRSHTLNPVPTMVWGLYRETAKQRITSLVDITPTIVSLLTRAQRA